MNPYADRLLTRDEHLRRRRRAGILTVACVAAAGVLSALLALLTRLT